MRDAGGRSDQRAQVVQAHHVRDRRRNVEEACHRSPGFRCFSVGQESGDDKAALVHELLVAQK